MDIREYEVVKTFQSYAILTTLYYKSDKKRKKVNKLKIGKYY